MARKILKKPPVLLFWPVIVAGLLTAAFRGASAMPGPEVASSIFTDVTEAGGITWKHFNGESPDAHLIETKNGGAAFFDFDQDGLLDIFLVNGGETPRGKSPTPVRNALYRNLGNGKFEEIAAKAGVNHISFYGIGAAVGDYDNDGYPDLLVTGYPERALFHNNRDGTFSEVAGKASLKGSGRWSTGAAWFDYDRDGWLDLAICHYGEMSFAAAPRCEFRGTPTYCAPSSYGKGAPLALYRNNGNGTFADASTTSGVDKSIGRGLGAVAVDVDDDGWTDLFVARDGSPNLLLMNQRNGTLRDFAMEAEVAYDSNGVAKAGMGIDAADVNGDGRPDFVITNFNNEQHSLFINRGKFPFEDWTVASSLGFLTASYVGWGTHFLDYDNDGIMDLLIVSGHVNKIVELTSSNVTYKELPLLLRNDGKSGFRNMQEAAGPAFQTRYDARGLTVGDYDNDGDVDAALIRLQDTPVLLRNNVGENNSWVGFELVGTKSNRDAIGAKLTVRLGDRKLVRWITGGASIFSSHD
ncbi:MAG TPA: VCBS repeat-containing protein, partial [Terriglobia bacterium]|nr:VCBS repeat-containing protein [Terriglobia bacterium]